jgi:hypothetical protein
MIMWLISCQSYSSKVEYNLSKEVTLAEKLSSIESVAQLGRTILYSVQIQDRNINLMLGSFPSSGGAITEPSLSAWVGRTCRRAVGKTIFRCLKWLVLHFQFPCSVSLTSLSNLIRNDETTKS